MATERLSDVEQSKLIQLVQGYPCIWNSRVSDYFDRDKALERCLENVRQMGSEMTGEFLCFVGLSFLVSENYALMDGADFDLCSDHR